VGCWVWPGYTQPLDSHWSPDSWIPEKTEDWSLRLPHPVGKEKTGNQNSCFPREQESCGLQLMSPGEPGSGLLVPWRRRGVVGGLPSSLRKEAAVALGSGSQGNSLEPGFWGRKESKSEIVMTSWARAGRILPHFYFRNHVSLLWSEVEGAHPAPQCLHIFSFLS
jgi:hypothetical protein